MLNAEISVGDILTACSVVISACAILIAWRKDRQIRRREYAERVRCAVGEALSRLDRWGELASGFFYQIEPLITAADILLVDEQEPIAVRDTLWKDLVGQKATTSITITTENLRTLPGALYPYGVKVCALFQEAVRRLDLVESAIFHNLLLLTQLDVLNMTKENNFRSAELGNRLRMTCGSVSQAHGVAVRGILEPLRKELRGVLESSDRDLPAYLQDLQHPDAVWANWHPPGRDESQSTAARHVRSGFRDLGSNDGIDALRGEALACEPSFNRYTTYWTLTHDIPLSSEDYVKKGLQVGESEITSADEPTVGTIETPTTVRGTRRR